MSEQTGPEARKKGWWQWMILLLTGLFVFIVPVPVGANLPTERIIHIDARQFEYSPAVIHVNPGDRVTIELAATDVVHGLSIDGYGVETTADPGTPARISFTADRQGAFRFHCTATCGNMHPFMTGKLVVGQNMLLLKAMVFSGLALAAGVWYSRRK